MAHAFVTARLIRLISVLSAGFGDFFILHLAATIGRDTGL